jgi:hypothetical protein
MSRRGLAVAVLAQGAGSAALLLLPQFDHLGHFHNLGTAVLAVLLAAPLTALGWRASPTAAVLADLPRTWWWLALASVLPPALLELVTGGCRDPIGAADFLVTTGVGLLISLTAAAGVSRLGRAGPVLAGWLGVVLLTTAWALAPLVTGPQVFVLHPLAGYFPGPIYDRMFALPQGYLLERAAGLGAALAVVQGLRVASGGPRQLAVRAALLAAAVGGVHVGGAWLGLRVDGAALERALPGQRTHAGLTLRFDPTHTPPAVLDAAWDDARFAYDEARDALGGRADRVTLHAFPSDDARGDLLGTRRVAVTKPWRAEAYLSLGSWDGCTVEHELLHALLAPRAHAALGIPWTGGLPNLGLVEGAAEGLTACPERFPVHWQARRMLDEGALPEPADLVSPARFWTLPGRRAYAAAASFVAWLVATRGVEVLLAAYGTGDVATAAGEPLEGLADGWRAWLQREVVLAPEDQALLAEHLSQRSIFTERCSQERARSLSDVPALVACGAWSGVQRALERAERVAGEAVDPLLAVRARVAQGHDDDARAALDALLAAEPPLPLSFWARLARADLEALAGRLEAARGAWTALRDGVKDESLRRQVAMRLLALREPALPLDALRDVLLFPVGGRAGREAWKALTAGRHGDARVAYLRARRDLGALRADAALARLRDVRADATAFEGFPEVQREALRLLGTAAYRAGDLALARQTWTDLYRDADRPSERRLPEEWLRRISRSAWR